MSRMRSGNPKKSSTYICVRCCKTNNVLAGMQRTRQTEFLHIKDCMCCNPECNGEVTKNVEIRFCDFKEEIEEYIPILHDKYYDEENNLRQECKLEDNKRKHTVN